MNKLKQRVATTTCAKCRTQFSPGDRVTVAYIVHTIGRNPATKDIGAMLGEDFELVHISCADAQLDGKIIIPT